MTLRVGVHPNNLHLQIAALAWRDASASGIQFIPYNEGRDTAKLIDSGRIDIGGTGSTPPLRAQAAGVALVYVAASAPRKTNGALVVRAADGATTIAELAGRRIALLDGSFHTYFLAAALQGTGHMLNDVERVELAPAASLQALRAGRVDAWVAMEPHLATVRNDPAFRVLGWVGDYVTNRSVFWARRAAVDTQADAVAALLRALAELGRAIDSDPAPYARLLAKADVGASDAATWHAALARRDWTLLPIDATVLAEQQAEADLLFKHGALERTIDVHAASRALADFETAPQ